MSAYVRVYSLYIRVYVYINLTFYIRILCVLKLAHAALDLCQLVITPLEDVFCTVRKMGIGDFRYIETGERCVAEALRLLCCVFVACTSERPHGMTVPAPPQVIQIALFTLLYTPHSIPYYL
jgi:hypothetical protein